MIGPNAKFLMKLNGFLTIALIVFTAFWVHDIRSRYIDLSARAKRSDVMSIVSEVLNDNDMTSATQQLMTEQLVKAIFKDLQPLISNATNVFFFGAAQGTIPMFAQNLFTFSFREFGASASAFASSVNRAFAAAREKCGVTKVCPFQGTVQCPDGSSVWCPDQGAEVECGNCGIYRSFADPAALVNSIANVLATEWNDIPSNTPTSSAAFSEGIFRLDLVLQWVQSQFSIEAWQSAGDTCTKFVSAVDQTYWGGQYIGPNGNVHSWNADDQVKNDAKPVNKVCSTLKTLS